MFSNGAAASGLLVIPGACGGRGVSDKPRPKVQLAVQTFGVIWALLAVLDLSAALKRQIFMKLWQRKGTGLGKLSYLSQGKATCLP